MTQGQIWIDDFYSWMLRTGRPKKRLARPTLGMKPSTAKDYLQRLCRLLCNTTPPYLKANVISRHNGTNGQVVAQWLSGDEIRYQACRDIRELKVAELISGIKELFPRVTDSEVPNYRHFQQAGVVLIRWLIFEKTTKHGKTILTQKDMDTWREQVPSLKPKAPQMDIIEPEIVDSFLEWLCDKEHDLWAPAWAMRNLGLRYSGMRNAKVDLNGGPKDDQGSIKLSVTRQIITTDTTRTEKLNPEIGIWEKQTPRQFQLWPSVYSFLTEHQKYQKEHHPSSIWFFVNRRGLRYHLQSGSFNAALQRQFRNYMIEKYGDVTEQEIDLLTAHKLRHACGTFLVKKNVPLPMVKEILGHQDYSVIDRYVQHVNKNLGSMVATALGDLQ